MSSSLLRISTQDFSILSYNLLKLGGAPIREREFTLTEVTFDTDNWPKVGDALYRERELISERIQYIVTSSLNYTSEQR